MSIIYFVRDYNNPYHKIYLNVKYIICDIPNRFTININNYPFEYKIEDVEVESDSISPEIPMIIMGILGLLIHPVGGIIGAIIGYIAGLNQNKIDIIELEQAKETLKRLYKSDII